MTITYRTVVLHIPPTPLGLLPERWTVEHYCNLCRQRVTPETLVAHTRNHDYADAEEPRSDPRSIAPTQPEATDDTKPDICMVTHTPTP